MVIIQYGREKEKHIFHYNSVVNNSIEEISFSKSIKMSHSEKKYFYYIEQGESKNKLSLFLLEDLEKHDVKCLPKHFQVLSKLKRESNKKEKRGKTTFVFTEKG